MRQIDVHKPADSGVILAPILISVLVGLKLPLQQNFMAIAIPAVVAITAIALVTIAVARRRVSASARHQDANAEMAEPVFGSAVRPRCPSEPGRPPKHGLIRVRVSSAN